MSQSVKLKDGSYIDASGVWDNTQGKTQEEINNQCAAKFIPTGVDVGSYIANRCTMWRRKGMIIVTFNVTLKAALSKSTNVAYVINLSDLGLTAFDCAAMNAVTDFGITTDWVYACAFPESTAIQVQTQSKSLAGTSVYGSICIPILND